MKLLSNSHTSLPAERQDRASQVVRTPYLGCSFPTLLVSPVTLCLVTGPFCDGLQACLKNLHSRI